MKFLAGYRRITAALLIVVPLVLGFAGISLPEGTLKDILSGVDQIVAAVLLIASARSPAPSAVEK